MSSKENTLIIRADASASMGVGHVMRCIALGQAWVESGGKVIFLSTLVSDVLKRRIIDEGFGLVALDAAYPGSDTDLAALLALGGNAGARWVVVDGYHFDLTYQKTLRQGGFKLLCIDDYNHLPKYEADILLNQNIDAEALDYDCNSGCLNMLGLKSVLLRREFRMMRAREDVADPVRHVLILLGGSDPGNVTTKVVEALRELDFSPWEIKILVGPANAHSDEIVTACERLPIELLFNVTDMPELLCRTDFAISAGGSTCWELAAAGVPFATVTVADNQEGIVDGLERRCGVPSLGRPDAGFKGRVLDLFNALAAQTVDLDACRARLLAEVSTGGAEHVVNEMRRSQ
ncbi:MAG: UDP-2,4-diacetamido-2,4,6-trideoxy-beta-L-altropyranose hydrolase [Candidatus Promineifilaceae bacterium]|jgi:UDP-2,4-diacetamido-2,4,6-trideoxy-beta-L-altropyranose hydrolase